MMVIVAINGDIFATFGVGLDDNYYNLKLDSQVGHVRAHVCRENKRFRTI